MLIKRILYYSLAELNESIETEDRYQSVCVGVGKESCEVKIINVKAVYITKVYYVR